MTQRLHGFRSFGEWQRERDDNAAPHHDEWRELESLRNTLTTQGVRGHCAICDEQRNFTCAEIERGEPVSFRESMSCEVCRGNARQRSTAAALLDAIDPQSSTVYLTEQTSHVYLHLRRRVKKIIGSELVASLQQRLWLTLWLLRNGCMELARREDVTALSLATASVDAVVTMDVLEHVHDVRRALAEFARVLRPGGVLVLTVPFYADNPHSTARARINAEGHVEHLQLPPEYHGDPLSGGVLCFHHFGWDLLDAIRQAGLADAEALRIRDPSRGLPEAQWVVRARKSS